MSSIPADLRLHSHDSDLQATCAIISLLGRHMLADRAGWALPVTAVATVSSLTLSVAGGVHHFFSITGSQALTYRFLAVVALVLLVVPLAGLAGAAARLSTTRRDTRLSSLRLLGATRTTVSLLTLVESAVTALAGSVLGLLGYVALMPLFGLLRFNGRRIGATGMWWGTGPVVLTIISIVAICVVSAAISLRRVQIDPIGVRTRQRAPRATWLRLALALVGFVVAVALSLMLRVSPGAVVAMGMLCGMLALPLVAVTLLGPWLMSVLARRDLRRARTAVHVLAARTVLENPKQAWRQVAALGLTSFVGVLLGVGMGFAQSPGVPPDAVTLFGDIQTGVLLTMGISFLSVACSVGINQAATVLDRRSLYVGLDMVGTPLDVMDAARRRAVLRPLAWVVGVSALMAATLVVPLGVVQAATNPWSIVACLGVLVAGVVVVRLALAVTRATLEAVLVVGTARVE